MRTVHTVSLEEAKTIIREAYKLPENADIEIEDVITRYTPSIQPWPTTISPSYPYPQNPVICYTHS